MYRNLNAFIKELESCGELIRIAEFVDPVLEIAEITDRVSKSAGGGKALLFENTGTGFPVLTNMFGSDIRMKMALGVEDLGDIGRRIDAMFEAATSPKSGIMDKLRMLPILAEAAKWMPRNKSGRGECQQVIDRSPDLSQLPVLKCWPHDGGRFITLPLVHTRDLVSGSRNVGMYRMQVLDGQSTGMHWHLHKTGARHYEQYRKAGVRQMPVAVCLGGDPAYTYAATAPLPDGVDEYMLAGFLRQKPVEMVKCVTCDLEVPADCDFVIEGYVDTAEGKVVEGPFGDHTGFYSLEDMYPVFHVTCITHRRDAVYPATIVGVPPEEDAYIAKATERIFLAPIRLMLQPEVRDMYLPEEGVAHNIAIVDIEKSYAGQGVKVASAMWGAGQMMFNKFMIVTSAEGDIHDIRTLKKLVGGLSIPRDILFSRGTLDVLDHSAVEMGVGGKICIDMTECETSEYFDNKSVKNNKAYFDELENEGIKIGFMPDWYTLFLGVPKGFDMANIDVERLEGAKFILVFDIEVPISDCPTAVWIAGNNIDPQRDAQIIGKSLVMDARVKDAARPFPNIVTAAEETIAEVDRRWAGLGLGEFIASPSIRYRPIVMSDSAEIPKKIESRL